MPVRSFLEQQDKHLVARDQQSRLPCACGCCLVTGDLDITLVRIIYMCHGVIGSISMSGIFCRHHQAAVFVLGGQQHGQGIWTFSSRRGSGSFGSRCFANTHCMDVLQSLCFDGNFGRQKNLFIDVKAASSVTQLRGTCCCHFTKCVVA